MPGSAMHYHNLEHILDDSMTKQRHKLYTAMFGLLLLPFHQSGSDIGVEMQCLHSCLSLVMSVVLFIIMINDVKLFCR